MQLVDKSYCNRCGKHTGIVRLIPKGTQVGTQVGSTLYVILCRACLDSEWTKSTPKEIDAIAAHNTM